MCSRRVHAIVHGRVQRVAFRFYTEQTARNLELTGWVCNRADGTVEVEAEGQEDKVAAFLAWLEKGPPFAIVRRVEVTEKTPLECSGSFEIRFCR